MSAITKDQAIAIASRAHARDTRLRQHQSAIEAGLVRKATVSLAAAATGALKKHGVPNDIKGFPWKTGLVVGATLAEALSKSRMWQSIFGGIADSNLAIYVHDAVATGSLVAGDGGEL
jgi:hypothetical protein